MEEYTLNKARIYLSKLTAYTAKSHRPVAIIGADSTSVLMAKEDYLAMVESLYLYSIPGTKVSGLDPESNSERLPRANFSKGIDWQALSCQ